MVKVFASLTIPTVALVAAVVSGASVPDGTWPTSQGTVEYSEVYVVAAGETFDGGLKTYQRSDITCEGQEESGTSTAVFSVEAGGTLKNVIIGANQMEGVHCDDHDCTIENVWWDDVCEDALSIKGGSASSVSTVTGGGARSADDKVVQHNGYGTVKIDGFYAEDFGKLYRSCGTCGDKQRFVSVSNVYAVNPGKSIVTVNENYDDEATLSNIYIKADDDDYDVCAWSQGNEDGEPTELGAGIKDPLCQYSESDIHINEDVSSATSTASEANSTTTTDEGDDVYTIQTIAPSSSGSSVEEGNDDDVYTIQTIAPSSSGSSVEEGNDDDVYSIQTIAPSSSGVEEGNDDDVYTIQTIAPSSSGVEEGDDDDVYTIQTIAPSSSGSNVEDEGDDVYHIQTIAPSSSGSVANEGDDDVYTIQTIAPSTSGSTANEDDDDVYTIQTIAPSTEGNNDTMTIQTIAPGSEDDESANENDAATPAAPVSTPSSATSSACKTRMRK